MKQKSLHHPQHRPYPQDHQGSAYCRDDNEGNVQGADSIEDSSYSDSIRDWQNPSRFRRDAGR